MTFVGNLLTEMHLQNKDHDLNLQVEYRSKRLMPIQANSEWKEPQQGRSL